MKLNRDERVAGSTNRITRDRDHLFVHSRGSNVQDDVMMTYDESVQYIECINSYGIRAYMKRF